MEILIKLNFVLLTLLNISAGIAKIMLTPQEVEFLRKSGLNESVVFVFGIVQRISGILLIIKQLRGWGAILTAVMFASSTIIIFVNEMVGFGLFSILPIVLTGFIIREYYYIKRTSNE